MILIFRTTAATALVVLGSIVWSSRIDTDIPEQLSSGFGASLTAVSPNSVVDLTRVCDEVRSLDAWLLFAVETEVKSDNKLRRYFQTATDDRGIFLEYDGPEQGNLRVGMGTAADAVLTRVRTVRRNERATILIAVQPKEIRVILSGVDRVIPWANQLGVTAACDAVAQFSTTSPECEDCRLTLRYATGKNVQRLNNELDALANVGQLNARRWLGSAMVLAGLGLSLTRRDALNRLRKRLDRLSRGGGAEVVDR